MIQFFYHDGIQKEIAVLERRFRTIRDGFSAFERLSEKQFDPLSPQQVIAPAKLHRITQNDVWTLWKVELVLPNSGLRPNQWPRMWFGVKGANINWATRQYVSKLEKEGKDLDSVPQKEIMRRFHIAERTLEKALADLKSTK